MSTLRATTTITTTRHVAAVATTVSALLLLGACGSGDDAEPGRSPSPEASSSASATPSASTSASAEEGVVVDVRLTPDGPEPRGKRVEVKVGEPVTLNVTSEVADEVHVHSDPEVSIDVQPGDETSRTFTIDRPGQVAVESHETDAVIVQLVVRP